MDLISLEKANHLFWLGRYIERVFSSVRNFIYYYDEMLDMDNDVYKTYCRLLDIPDIYESKDDFICRYMNDLKNPDSIAANLQRAYDNAVVLRDEISSESLSYIQMAVDTLQRANGPRAPLVEMTVVVDDIFAFWGSVDDNVLSEECRNLMKCGKYIERLDLNIRLSAEDDLVEKTYSKLMNRIKRVHIALNEDSLNDLGVSMVGDNGYFGALEHVNRIFNF